jgi:single-strand DNA-binding protein
MAKRRTVTTRSTIISTQGLGVFRWMAVVVWHDLAEACNNHLHKDSRMYVDGRLKTRSWQDQSGQTRERTEV